MVPVTANNLNFVGTPEFNVQWMLLMTYCSAIQRVTSSSWYKLQVKIYIYVIKITSKKVSLLFILLTVPPSPLLPTSCLSSLFAFTLHLTCFFLSLSELHANHGLDSSTGPQFHFKGHPFPSLSVRGPVSPARLAIYLPTAERTREREEMRDRKKGCF